jgi:hypothetical protein
MVVAKELADAVRLRWAFSDGTLVLIVAAISKLLYVEIGLSRWCQQDTLTVLAVEELSGRMQDRVAAIKGLKNRQIGR